MALSGEEELIALVKEQRPNVYKHGFECRRKRGNRLRIIITQSSVDKTYNATYSDSFESYDYESITVASLITVLFSLFLEKEKVTPTLVDYIASLLPNWHTMLIYRGNPHPPVRCLKLGCLDAALGVLEEKVEQIQDEHAPRVKLAYSIRNLALSYEFIHKMKAVLSE